MRERSPDVLCVTAHTSEIEFALECCRRAKRIRRDVITVGGGIHLTMFPDLGEEEGCLDFVIRGEGEMSLPRLVCRSRRMATRFVGYSSRSRCHSVRRPGALSRLCRPDAGSVSGICRRRSSILLTKRGCPWQCVSAADPASRISTRSRRDSDGERRVPTFRHRSVENVIAEMEMLWQRYAFRGVVFHDDQFLIRKEWVVEFCRALHTSGFVDRGIRWWAASRADIVCRYPEIIETMRDAGLQILSIGFESFSDPMLRWMRKDTTVRENLEAAEICRELGIDIFANVILGMPDSDGRWHLDHDKASLEAIGRIRPRYFSPSFFSPIPGSWFFEWALGKELLAARDPQRTGSRNPTEEKIRGVDYEQLTALLDDFRATFPDETPTRRSFRQRLRHFLDRPLQDKARVIRDKVARLGNG